MKFLPYGRQHISEADIEAVVKTLRSDFLTQGPAIESFEQSFCEATGARFSVCCSNGTAALHLATLAAGVTAGDRVIVTPVTFVASANCARYVGAEVCFADIDRNTLTMSPSACEAQLKKLAASGKPAKAVVTVDLAGQPCDMNAFASLKQKYGFTWIQDACHSIGASWIDQNGNRQRIGESPLPDLTVYSFHPVKHITCGEGGMITTHSPEFAKALRLYRTHGIVKEPEKFVDSKLALAKDGSSNPWYYEMQELGFNYRLTDIQAALAQSQLKRLSQSICRRREIVEYYRRHLSGLEYITFPEVLPGVEHAYHLAIIEIDFARIGKCRAQIMNHLKERGIGSQVHYIPIPLMPYYSGHGSMEQLPAALDYYERALSIPCYPDLSDQDLGRVVEALKEAIA